MKNLVKVLENETGYQYDAVGNVFAETPDRNGRDNTTYQYDAKNQLIRAEDEEGIRTYTYDA